MEHAGYGQFVVNNINSLPYGVPIYTEDIANNLAKQFHLDIGKAKGLVNVNLNRIAQKLDLERFQKGIYFKAKVTPFGKTKLNPAYITQNAYLLKNEESIGYETGATFMNQIGLTTQMAKYRYIVTNVFNRNGCKIDDKLHVVIRKPYTFVTNENYKYLQILDAVENKEKVPVDANEPNKVILEYIKSCKLDIIKLLAYASKYYGKETLRHLGEIAACELQ